MWLFSTGYYLFIEATFGHTGDQALLLSPEGNYKGSGCLTFYSYMFGQHIGTLEVFVIQAGSKKRLFVIAGEQSDSWVLNHVDLLQDEINIGAFSFLFVATRGPGYAGDIGLDDIGYTVTAL